MRSFRVATVMLILLVAASQSLAEVRVERKSGPCKLRSMTWDDFLKARDPCLLVDAGQRAQTKYYCWAENMKKVKDNDPFDRSGYGIQVYSDTTNITKKHFYILWSIAFFDKKGNFLASACYPGGGPIQPSKDDSRGWTIQSSHSFGSKLFLPGEVLRQVASYQLTHYASDQPLGIQHPPLQDASKTPDANQSQRPDWKVLWTGARHSLAQTAEGKCTIQCPEKDFDVEQDLRPKSGFCVDFGEKAQLRGWYHAHLSSGAEGNPWYIGSSDRVYNPTNRPIYFQYFVAFFDKSGNLVGAHDGAYSWGPNQAATPGVKPGQFESTHCHGDDSFLLPDDVSQTIASYKIAYYESSAPLGQE